MARANKILSNIVGLAAAREACQGYLGGETDERTGDLIPVTAESPALGTWKKYEPNTYADTGATITTTAPNPISETRQRNKGIVTDLEASIGFNHNVSATNMRDMFEAALFADTASPVAVTTTNPASDSSNNGKLTSPEVDNSLSVIGYRATANGNVWLEKTDNTSLSLNSDAAEDSFTTFGFEEGDWLFIGGDTPISNYDSVNKSFNGFKRIRSITARKITFDKTNGAEVAIAKAASSAKRIEFYVGNSLKNSTVRPNNTFQFERTLGNSDGGADTNQSELITGCVLNEVSINFPASGLVNADLGFVAKDQKLLSGSDANKAAASGNVSDELLKSDILNTVSDISRMNLSRIGEDGSIIQGSDFFNFVTEASLTINNGVTPDKALSVLGSFDYSIGNFIVSGSLQAYFANVDAVRAVRENADVTLDYALVKENAGIVFDLPLITLGDGRLNVEEGQSIRLPLNTEAANAEKHGLPYTMKIVFFPYLPNLADSV